MVCCAALVCSIRASGSCCCCIRVAAGTWRLRPAAGLCVAVQGLHALLQPHHYLVHTQRVCTRRVKVQELHVSTTLRRLLLQ
jgi:hypothetical protein